ncbi:type VI secretion system tip protein VgrG, partial [Xanthomonas oryzae pv. oryzae]|uniref:DUF2345 domain-containing protein n=1 Tax=Xanthomonas oryzae TaxID=347 RepID=UPI000DDD1BFD
SNQTLSSLVSGEGALDVQAQSDDVRVQSKEGLKLISANADVALAAGKTLHLAVAGGASVTIEGGNITVACSGTITVHASKKSFVGPVQHAYPLPAFAKSVCIPCLLQAMGKGHALSPVNG